MKKIYLLEVTQHNVKRYVGKVDARDLVRMANKVELQEVQEAQRPVSKKRLEEIAAFVRESGLLSTSIVIGTTNDNMVVHPVREDTAKELYYMEFPETDTEFEAFQNSFDIMDGQHRLFSFLSEFVKIADDVKYEVTFEIYIKPTTKVKRIIFKNTNEKQEKVSPNLLMWFRAMLNMLTEKEKKYHPVVSLLNQEACSPLQNRIIMGAERISGGVKALQLINVLDKVDVKEIGENELTEDKMLKMITEYLSGWEKAVGSKIADRDKELGAFSKISGIRFMLLMLLAFYEQAVEERERFSSEYIKTHLNSLFANAGMQPRDIFDKNSAYIENFGNNPFASETSTTIFAKEWIRQLKNLTSNAFEPLV